MEKRKIRVVSIRKRVLCDLFVVLYGKEYIFFSIRYCYNYYYRHHYYCIVIPLQDVKHKQLLRSMHLIALLAFTSFELEGVCQEGEVTRVREMQRVLSLLRGCRF